MRRLITLISAGRNRTIVIRRELPRTKDAGWAVGPYHIERWRILLRKCSSGCFGQGFDGDLQPQSLQPFRVISLELVFVDLLQIVAAEFVVASAGVQHVVADDEHGVATAITARFTHRRAARRLNCADR